MVNKGKERRDASWKAEEDHKKDLLKPIAKKEAKKKGK